jgi:hypothetical protein
MKRKRGGTLSYIALRTEQLHRIFIAAQFQDGDGVRGVHLGRIALGDK